MGRMQQIIKIATHSQEGLYDITKKVAAVVAESGVKDGLASIYVRGATAAVMIQENWDQSVQADVVNLFRKLIPQGIWEHDLQDNNGAAHLKAGVIGPGEIVPIIEGRLGLSNWQNLFLCEFDGPREEREIVITLIAG